MFLLHQNSGGIGKSIPSTFEISLHPRDFPLALPSGNLLDLKKSVGRRAWISQYLLRFGGARIQCNRQVHLKTNYMLQNGLGLYFVVIYATLSQKLFCCALRTFYVEKNGAQNFIRGEKMRNIYVCI